MYPFQPAFTPITPKELSVSDTTFKVFVLWQGIEPCSHSYQECVITILLQEQFCGLGESRYPDPSLNRRTLFLWATSPILPHFTGLTDRLPYWEWGFPVNSGLRGVVGIEPNSMNYIFNHLSCRFTSISDSNTESSFNPLTPNLVTMLFCELWEARIIVNHNNPRRYASVCNFTFLESEWGLTNSGNNYLVCGSPGNRTPSFRFSV